MPLNKLLGTMYYLGGDFKLNQHQIIRRTSKRYLFSLLVIIISLSAVYGCKKQVLPMHEYPLDIDMISAALEEAELPWAIVGDELLMEGRIVYTLHDEAGSLVAFILTSIHNERRFLDASFMPYSDNPTITRALPEAEWEKAIAFATLLYGGFDSKYQVYNSFTNDFDTKNTDTVSPVRTEGKDRRIVMNNMKISTWKDEINGINCTVKIEQPNINLPQGYLNTVRFDNTDEEGNLIK